MSLDKFGNIRINPDDKKNTPEDNEAERRADYGTTHLPARTSRHTRKREFPFRPGRAMLWIAVPLFLALLYGVGSYFLVPSLIKGPVSKSLSDSFGRPVQVERVVFSPFFLRVYLTDISVGSVYGDVNGQDLLTCASFTCRLDFAALFGRKLVCHEVKVNGVSLNLLKFRLGSFNFDDAVNFFSLLKQRSESVLWPEWLVFDGVRLGDSRIVIDDDVANKQHHIEQVSFYLPSVEEARAGSDVMPRLNAVVNSSPVQIDGRRQKNDKGDMETRFTLKFFEIVLQEYLSYLPALQQSPFQLAGGQADIDIDFVIPELTDGITQKVSFQLSAAIKGLSFLNRDGQQVLKVPEARVEVQAFPHTMQYLIKNIFFSRPEFTFILDQSSQEQKSGVSFRDLDNFAQGVDAYPYGIECEKFSWKGGVFHLAYGRQGKSSYVWNGVDFVITGYANDTFRKQNRKSDVPAFFSLGGNAQSDGGEMLFLSTGKIYRGLRVDGTVKLTNLDLHQYSRFMPIDISFKKGRVDLESSFLLAVDSGTGEPENEPQLRLSDGRLILLNFIFRNKKEKVVSGKRLECLKLQVKASDKQLSCDKLLLDQGDIYSAWISLADLQPITVNSKTWKLSTRMLEITGSTLHEKISSPFDKASVLPLEVSNFFLQADNLQSKVIGQNNIKASGRINKKGKVLLVGTYLPVPGKGLLSVTLKNTDVSTFKPFVAPWLVPELKKGTVNVAGSYVVENKTFNGTIQVDNFYAGQASGPSVSWKKSVSEEVRIQFAPLSFHARKTALKQPVIMPGISHADKSVSLFIRPSRNRKPVIPVTINTVHFEDGTLELPEPVIAPGYQPKLSNITGTLSSLGSEVMPFSVQGTLEKDARFVVRGSTGMKQVNDYSLEVSNVPLDSFQAVLKNGGIEAGNARGSWQQDMSRENEGMQVANRIWLLNIRPNPGSSYFRIISMYIDNTFSLYFAGEERLDKGKPSNFLLDILIRGIQHDGVKAELSEQLILSKLLPDLNLVGQVLFDPGSSKLRETESMSGYTELLHRRPFLRLELTGNFDRKADVSALQEILQKETDLLREAENRKRAEKRLKEVEEEKSGLKKMKNDPGKIIEERIDPVEFSPDLQPLPQRVVRVSREMLVELARKRTQAVYEYLLDQLSVKSDRVTISAQTGESGTGVTITVQPYYFAREIQKGANK